MNTASIIFTLNGESFEYDGALPDVVIEAAHNAGKLDENGFWRGGYPDLAGEMKSELDELPTARWEIEHVGGVIQEIRGARPNGAIHHEDWKRPRIY